MIWYTQFQASIKKAGLHSSRSGGRKIKRSLKIWSGGGKGRRRLKVKVVGNFKSGQSYVGEASKLLDPFKSFGIKTLVTVLQYTD